MQKKWLVPVLLVALAGGGWLAKTAWRAGEPRAASVPPAGATASSMAPSIASATALATASAAATPAGALANAGGGNNDTQLGQRLAGATKKPLLAGDYKVTEWEDLIPKSWDPLAPFKGLDMDKLDDADPRAMRALKNLRASWDNAPIEPAMDGKPVRIAGFIVPIDSDKGHIVQFLLVPYFGACIHTPAPPLNQVIDVTPGKPTSFQMMETVWISGTLEATRSETVMGNAGYRMRNARLARYVPETQAGSSQAFE